MRIQSIACVLTLFILPLVATAGSSNSLMDVSADGTLLACSNRDAGSVTFVDLKTLQVVSEIHVGKKPEGVSFIGDSHQLACCVYAEDKVIVVSPDSEGSLKSISVFDEPYGLVSTKDGKRLFVTLDYPGRVVEIDIQKARVIREIDAGSFVRGIAISADQQSLFVTEYYTAELRRIDRKSGNVVQRYPGASTDNLCRQVVLHPTRDKAYLTHIRSRVKAAHGEGSIFPYVSVVSTALTEDDDFRTRIPMDSFLRTVTTANPWECAVSPDGKKFYAIFGGTDDIFACKTIDDDYNEIQYQAYIRTGKNPRAVKVSADSRSFYVYNALDFEVVEFDAASMKQKRKVRVCSNTMPDDVLRGKILFYSAQQPMASRRWISCSGCHPDGDTDGRTWQNPEGLRNTPPLAGLAWTHPLHWSADRDETQDFEHTIRGPLMQGRGLIKGRNISKSLDEPLKGRSEDLDALAAYTNSHEFSLSPYAKNGLTESAIRGKEIFFSKKTRCFECHSGPMYSDSRPENERLTHDVGTGKVDESEQMGPKYDTPTLLGIYRSAPYLHHGTAASLMDVLTTENQGDRHGTTSHLKKPELQDLVEFLKSLPYESPEKAAVKAGLRKVRN